MELLEFVETAIEKKQDIIFQCNDALWDYAELSNQEYKSSALLCRLLEKEGFDVTCPIYDLTTSFKASYGNGHPVIALLGEYDALPGLSQTAGTTHKEALKEGAPGHGCGHNALGAGTLAAALAMKEYLDTTGKPGTVIYFGCAAEENQGAKPYLAMYGAFDDVDCALAWHPGGENMMVASPMTAIREMTYEFHGTASHAAATPEYGRSALDACEIMNIGVNYLREHMDKEDRVHYAYINSGGTAPNIVQDYASLRYCVRSLTNAGAAALMERINKIAEGAALITETRCETTYHGGYSDTFQNSVVARIIDESMVQVGVPKWDDEDYALAKKFTDAYDPIQRKYMEQTIRSTYPLEEQEERLQKPLSTRLVRFNPQVQTSALMSSTDVGDVGYVTPTAFFWMACCPICVPGHSWLATALGKTSISRKGMINAAKVMGLTGVKIFHTPSLLAGAREELHARTRGIYHCPVEGLTSPSSTKNKKEFTE